jgi:cell division septal protein FtsQ
MKLKRQPRPQPRRAPRASRGGRSSRGGSSPRGRQARRPGVPLRRRIGGRLPSIRRLLAGLGAAAAAAGLVALVSGPWLRVTEVTWAGEQFTAQRDLERVLDRQRGTSLLAVDTRSLRDRLERLPAVAEATVSASLPGRLEVTIVEREAAFVWETSSALLLGAADGTLFAALPSDATLEADVTALPRVADERATARLMRAGDRIPVALLRTALRLASLDPAALGSTAERLGVRLDDEFGFRLVAADPGWEMAFGVYGTDPNETAGDAATRLERQVTAVRTLFATQAEAEIGWVDARNPGKVYFRAKG